jgi:hypothetical protein
MTSSQAQSPRGPRPMTPSQAQSSRRRAF